MESTWIADPATDAAFVLGEGPTWDAERSCLLWVDIRSGLVLSGTVGDDRIAITDRWSFDSMVGAVAPGPSSSLLVAAQQGLVVIDATGVRSPGPVVLDPGAGRRLNDGKVDPRGRFVFGTLDLSGPGREILLRLEPDGRLTTIDDDLTMSNGLGWSVDGSRLYTVDTYRRTVWVRDYDLDGDACGARQAFVSLSDGFPDGMCVDAEDHVWVAIYGAGEVRRYTSAGELVGRVSVAAPHTTSAAFAGPSLDMLVVTTATQELTEAQLEQFPHSGQLFVVDVGVRGAPVPSWSGLYGTIST